MVSLQKVNLLSEVKSENRKTKRWSLREYRKEDQEGVRTLFFKVFNKHFSNEEFEWKYFNNPFGETIMLVVETASGEICAFHAAMPLMKTIGNATQIFYLGCDSMIDSAYRKSGLYAQILRGLLLRFNRNKGFFHGFPNLQALPSMKKRAGVYPLKLTAKVKVLRPLSCLFKFSRSYFCKIDNPEIEIFKLTSTRHCSQDFRLVELNDPAVSSFYSLALDKSLIQTVRSQDFFNWRYVMAPHRNYISFAYYVDKEMKANIILRIFRIRSYNIAAVMDFGQIQGSKALRKLLKLTVRTLRENKIDFVYSLDKVGSIENLDFKCNLFFSTSLNWYKRQFYLGLGSEYFYIANPDLAKEICPLTENEKSWIITLGDTDLI